MFEVEVLPSFCVVFCFTLYDPGPRARHPVPVRVRRKMCLYVLCHLISSELPVYNVYFEKRGSNTPKSNTYTAQHDVYLGRGKVRYECELYSLAGVE